MNTKKHLWNRLLTALLIAALLLVPAVPAFATGGEPSPDGTEANTPTISPDDGEPDTTADDAPNEPEPGTTPPLDDGEGNNTPEAETPLQGLENSPVTVSTLEELLQAIDQAEDGGIVYLAGLIELGPDTVLGSPDKSVTIQRADTGSYTGLRKQHEDSPTSIKIQNIIFDGAEIDNDPMIAVDANITLDNVTFKNCYSNGGNGAFNQWGGSAYLTNCVFDNNRGSLGAHIIAYGEILHLNNCSLTNGYVTEAGGALDFASHGMLNIENCVITQNESGNIGGGLRCSCYTTPVSIVNITNSKIYGNSAANGSSDIWNSGCSLRLNDSLDQMTSMYAEDDLVPLGWFYDYPTNALDAPTTVDRMPVMLKMAFEEPTPDPDTPTPTPDPTPSPELSPDPDPVDPTPTPDPTPEPEQTPDPEPSPEPTPTPSRPSGGYSRPSTTQEPEQAPQEPEQEEPKETTLTNGKAILKAPEALYWAGYKDSRGGGAKGITRADLAFLMASMMDQESRDEWAVGTASFDDVAPDAWYAAAIGTMENTGIMVGCGNGMFAPEGRLTWGELITVFSRFTGENEPPPEVYTGQHWAKDAIITAISLGWVEYSEAFDPGRAVTCEEMVDFIQAVFLWASD